ncbi:carbohydrate binding domain-containing protein [Streptomyces erythrochromogenes]|uniref:hypothetical protein n=1 Tax=Streptomyces erythrochromogenes TaxID=285574 RepID=UPI0036921223
MPVTATTNLITNGTFVQYTPPFRPHRNNEMPRNKPNDWLSSNAEEMGGPRVTLTGWRVSGRTGEIRRSPYDGPNTPVEVYAHEAAVMPEAVPGNAVDMNGYGVNGTISQTVITEPGVLYQLAYWIGTNTWAGHSVDMRMDVAVVNGDREWGANGGGSDGSVAPFPTIAHTTHLRPMALESRNGADNNTWFPRWEHQELFFVAESAATTISFIDYTAGHSGMLLAGVEARAYDCTNPLMANLQLIPSNVPAHLLGDYSYPGFTLRALPDSLVPVPPVDIVVDAPFGMHFISDSGDGRYRFQKLYPNTTDFVLGAVSGVLSNNGRTLTFTGVELGIDQPGEQTLLMFTVAATPSVGRPGSFGVSVSGSNVRPVSGTANFN